MLRGSRKLFRQPCDLGVVEVTVVVARNGRIERDDSKTFDVEDTVSRGAIRFFAEKNLLERLALIVVSHDPDQRCAELLRHGFDRIPDPFVRFNLGDIGEIAGEHECIDLLLAARQPIEHRREVFLDVNS
ncbi:unannotated protein [freshwater metagenome]|uniref:Unannotated protein n=1 Tax=freshwater metagenome TaxID=449393 RepID=A0A6J6GHU2_9ZZZZ